MSPNAPEDVPMLSSGGCSSHSRLSSSRSESLTISPSTSETYTAATLTGVKKTKTSDPMPITSILTDSEQSFKEKYPSIQKPEATPIPDGNPWNTPSYPFSMPDKSAINISIYNPSYRILLHRQPTDLTISAIKDAVLDSISTLAFNEAIKKVHESHLPRIFKDENTNPQSSSKKHLRFHSYVSDISNILFSPNTGSNITGIPHPPPSVATGYKIRYGGLAVVSETIYTRYMKLYYLNIVQRYPGKSWDEYFKHPRLGRRRARERATMRRDSKAYATRYLQFYDEEGLKDCLRAVFRAQLRIEKVVICFEEAE
ncbi:hypothetical protein BZA77DRAFT_357788 [Pyronema omphalodes]|nr:hypothetical protein BZA77DRAFT_357788 [Pyronema omphalodes]